MRDIAGEVLRAADNLGVKAEILSPEESRELWRLVAAVYSGGRAQWPLWEHLQDEISVQVEGANQKLAEFLGPAPALLLFEPSDEQRYFEFDAGIDISRVLEECFRFEFYVTDRVCTFLLCVNHHDFLIGAGSAKSWVANLKSEHQDSCDEGKVRLTLRFTPTRTADSRDPPPALSCTARHSGRTWPRRRE